MQQRCQQRGPATYDLLPQPPPGRGSANLLRLSGEASHQNGRASPTAGPMTRTVPPCESVEARCRKRVHGAGAICAYEEDVPRSRLLTIPNCGNPELGSIRSPYHQFKERLFRRYWSRCDIDVGNHAMTGTIGWLTDSAGLCCRKAHARRSLDKKTDHDRNQRRSRRRPRDCRQNQCLMYSGGADALCREASLLAGIEASCPDRQRQRPCLARVRADAMMAPGQFRPVLAGAVGPSLTLLRTSPSMTVAKMSADFACVCEGE
jgi:hypothetical protein